MEMEIPQTVAAVRANIAACPDDTLFLPADDCLCLVTRPLNLGKRTDDDYYSFVPDFGGALIMRAPLTRVTNRANTFMHLHLDVTDLARDWDQEWEYRLRPVVQTKQQVLDFIDNWLGESRRNG